MPLSSSGSSGTSGTNTGLRFNPRIAPEFLDSDDNAVGSEDPKKKTNNKAKKDKEKEDRDNQWAGLQHLKIKIPKKKDEGFNPLENVNELSENTGPASSTGTPLDQMTGARTGSGSSMAEGGSPLMGQYGLMRTGEPMDLAFRLLKEIDADKYRWYQEHGFPDEDFVDECTVCKGTGRISIPRLDGGPSLINTQCPDCEGTGWVDKHPGPHFTGQEFNQDTGFSTGEPMFIGGDLLTKKKTETLETVTARQRGVKAARTRKTRGRTTESYKTERKKHGKGPLRARTRNPKIHTTQSAGLKQTVRHTPGAHLGRRLTGRRYKGTRARPHKALPDPRTREARAQRSAVERQMPTQPITAPIPYQTGLPKYGLKPRGMPKQDRPSALMGPKKKRAPLQPKVKGGRQMLEHSTPSALSGGALMAMSKDVMSIADLLLKAPGISQADITEFKFLVRELKDLLKNSKLLRKNELEERKDRMDDPSPNAHPLQTSYATGATDVDPDNDPRYWGAHPLGLMVPRGGMSV